MSAIVWWFEHSLVLPFLEIGMRIDLFQSCGHWWVFQSCWNNACRTLMASSFRDVNSSAGISSYPLALLTAVLRKPHLTLPSRMSGSGWVTTPSWLSSSLRSFFEQFFCVFLPSLLDLFCFYKVFTNLSFIVPIFGWNILLIFLIFLKILLVFPLLFFSPYFFASFIDEGLLLSPWYSLELLYFKDKLACYSRYLLISCFCTPIPMKNRTSFGVSSRRSSRSS